jgi:NADH:ubiquinone oxidoreductase subunit
MIGVLKRIFSWWHAATIGTSFTLWKRKARLVGEDQQGNRYFEEGRAPSHPEGYKRRWVIYHGFAEGSRVPPDWHGWLHHQWDEPPTVAPLPIKKFERQHLPNMTGTPLAYRPSGSLARVDAASEPLQDYEAWTPEEA